MEINVISGDLITLAKEGKFNVITHGVNCFCRMARGIAPQMNEAFKCNEPNLYKMEGEAYIGDFNKLGTIEARYFNLDDKKMYSSSPPWIDDRYVAIINSYTQYHYHDPSNYGIPFDYDAFRLCMRKINHEYPKQHIGLPMIGAGLAKGNWNLIEKIISEELKDMSVTIVQYAK